MEDVERAKELIKEIRRNKHVDDPGGENETAVDLTNALKMLSEELYSKPAHFILELIQNADDNRYDRMVTPKLSLLYRHDGYLWVGINELGFTEANVRAICRIAASTKRVENQQKGYIGEKGIGFKAVFKVADVVWVKSGAMSFMFDKKKPLGMIAPEWTDSFPHTSIDEQTMFCFRIPNRADREIVRANLLELKPELLMFLRQLRNIDVKVQTAAGATQHHFTLSRSDAQVSGTRRTTLQHVTTTPRPSTVSDMFIVFQRTTPRMPAEAKRQGISESDVLIAFPVDAELQPVLGARLTFNFLPIRSYGLPFILQGDFMLSANREDILEDNEWNDALVASTIELFVSSVEHFNKMGLAKYTWPRYAKSQGNAYGTIFQSFFGDLLRRLRSCCCLESQAQYLWMPQYMEIVPPLFTDGAKLPRPLLVGRGGLQAYVSIAYAAADLSHLCISDLSTDTFYQLLWEESNNNAKRFRGKPAEWHSRLAEILLDTGHERVAKYRLIPLQDGQWVSTKQAPFYFANISEGLTVPSGIEIATIEQTAAQDQSRRQLFKALGAQILNPTEVCERIIQQHRVHNQSTHAWTVDNFVQHAWFIFNAPSSQQPYKLSDLRTVSHDSKIGSASLLYMDVPGNSFRVSDLFGRDSTIVRFLHDRYLRCAPPETAAAWYRWLQHDMGVNTLPRLTSLSETLPNRKIVSSEFRWLVDHTRSSFWLRLLKDNWLHYSPSLTESLRGLLSGCPVDCVGGTRHSIRDTYLNTASVAAEPLAAGTVPLVDVENHQDAAWTKLSSLGLGIKPDLRFYLVILESLSRLASTSSTLKRVSKIYASIEELMAGDKQLVKTTFSSAPLVYLELPQSSRWIGMEQCKWKAPACLSNVMALSESYAKFQRLFVETLEVKDADATDVIAELCNLSGAAKQVNAIKTLLLALQSCKFSSTSEQQALQRLRSNTMKIFPIRDESDGVRMVAVNHTSLFIPDLTRLQKAFKGKVAMPDFTAEELLALGPLLEKLGLGDRLLSKHVKEETQASGECVYQPMLTDALRSKAHYISYLAEADRRAAALMQLSTMEVWSASNLVLRRHIQVGTSRVYGTDETGLLVLRDVGGRLQALVSNVVIADDGMPTGLLSERLMETYSIPGTMQGTLMVVLVTKDTTFIEDILEKAHLLPGAFTLAGSGGTNLGNEDAATAGLFEGVTGRKAITSPTPRAALISHMASDSLKAPCLSENRTSRRQDAGRILGQPITHAIGTNGSSKISATADSTGAGAGATGIWASTTTSQSQGTNQLAPASKRRAFGMTPIAKGLSSTRQANDPNGGSGPGLSGSFDMASLRSALSTSVSQGTARGVQVAGVGMLDDATTLAGGPCSQTDQWQRDNGYGGEKFVFDLLKKEFGAGNDCWTSEDRSRDGLPSFEPFEGDYADFTISDPETCRRITAWLGGHGAVGVTGDNVTYHIEVKTTVGVCGESFSMSNNQVALAQNWHNSPSDVCVVFRVFDLLSSSPKVRAYVDPIALMQDGTLSFTAQGGYLVQGE